MDSIRSRDEIEKKIAELRKGSEDQTRPASFWKIFILIIMMGLAALPCALLVSVWILFPIGVGTLALVVAFIGHITVGRRDWLHKHRRIHIADGLVEVLGVLDRHGEQAVVDRLDELITARHSTRKGFSGRVTDKAAARDMAEEGRIQAYIWAISAELPGE
jgi:hypothetical protein